MKILFSLWKIDFLKWILSALESAVTLTWNIIIWVEVKQALQFVLTSVSFTTNIYYQLPLSHHIILSQLSFMTDLLQERAGRQVQPKGVAKQVIQTWSVMGEAFDLESRYKVIDYLGELIVGAPSTSLFYR